LDEKQKKRTSTTHETQNINGVGENAGKIIDADLFLETNKTNQKDNHTLILTKPITVRTQNTPAGVVVHVGDTARISQRSGFARGFLCGNPCGAVFVKDLTSGAVLGDHRKRRPPMLGRRGSRLGSSSTTEPVAPGRRHGERRRHVGVGVGVGFLLRRRRRRGAFGTVT
jgi:hypothetical protein